MAQQGIYFDDYMDKYFPYDDEEEYMSAINPETGRFWTTEEKHQLWEAEMDRQEREFMESLASSPKPFPREELPEPPF